MTVYIEADENNEFFNKNCYDAWKGFSLRGFQTEKYLYSNLNNGLITFNKEEDIVVGTIRSVKSALNQLRIQLPENIDIPLSLSSYCKRKYWKTTLGEIRNLKNIPVFIKPLNIQKAFTGHIVSNFKDLLKTAKFDDDFELFAQEPINIESEWRFYIKNNEIIGGSCYNGDIFLYPNQFVVKDMVNGYVNPPITYGLDVGVRVKENSIYSIETFLIEVNNGFALGNYCLSPIEYSKFLEESWKGMIK